jgi:hypothetical protein
VPFALDEPQAPAELLVEVVLSDAQRAANPELEVLRCSAVSQSSCGGRFKTCERLAVGDSKPVNVLRWAIQNL